MTKQSTLLALTVVSVTAFSTLVTPVSAQSLGTGNNNLSGGDKYNAITTAVPFLTITPDARSGALGESGTATSGDANSQFFNTAKLAFADKPIAASLSYTPWLRNLGFNDMFVSYLAGYYKLNKEDALSFGFTYFNLGQLAFTDQSGAAVRDFNPNELSLAAGYSRQLTSKFALGVNGKFIYSNLTGNFSNAADIQSRPGVSAAVDISGYYKTDLALGGTPANLVVGGSVSNFGPKISYSNNNRRDFLPTMLRVGSGLTLDLDPFNKITFLLEASKLMVPTPKQLDSATIAAQAGNSSSTANTNLLSGVFGSFTDAPGGGAEELREIMLGGGIEYWYDNLFAVRGGYFNENKFKGNRKYFTAGIGIRYQQFGLDVSYLVPSVQGANSPLANTLRFTLLVNFNAPTVTESTVTE